MRTNIVIDDALMTQAMSLSGLETKKAVVEEALKIFIQIQQQLLIRNFRGKLKWEGDLEQLRFCRDSLLTLTTTRPNPC